MDCLAVASSPDELLKELGVIKKGDLYALRSMCTRQLESVQWESKKKSLLDEFTQASSQRTKPKAKKETTRKIWLGWKHFNTKTQKYIVVFRSKGGGGEDVAVPQYASKQHIINEGKKIFFKNGTSRYYGSEEENDFYLMDNNGDEIPDKFCVQDYINTNRLSKLRFYISTKSKNAVQEPENTKDKGRKWRQSLLALNESKKYENIDTSSSDEDITDSLATSALIGSSSARSFLKVGQDNALAQSLKIDQDKEKKKQREIEANLREIERLERIRDQRSKRVPAEPLPGEQSVPIVVQHTALGRLKRLFATKATCSGIYDWIGSLNIEPEHFELCVSNLSLSVACAEAKISPSENVSKYSGCILHMKEREDPLPLDDNDLEVNFLTYGTVMDISNDITLLETLPSILMEDDR